MFGLLEAMEFVLGWSRGVKRVMESDSIGPLTPTHY